MSREGQRAARAGTVRWPAGTRATLAAGWIAAAVLVGVPAAEAPAQSPATAPPESTRLAPAVAAAQAACRAGIARIVAPDGRIVTVAVELADDPAERARGLMGRPALARGTGMLFVYETPRPASFWMKDTLIPLDMLFFDAAGVLRHVHARARPHDLTPIPGAEPEDAAPDRLLVLEIAGGEAARLGLATGARLVHPAVPPATAALPCAPEQRAP